jgi:hypothetical protein
LGLPLGNNTTVHEAARFDCRETGCRACELYPFGVHPHDLSKAARRGLLVKIGRGLYTRRKSLIRLALHRSAASPPPRVQVLAGLKSGLKSPLLWGLVLGIVIQMLAAQEARTLFDRTGSERELFRRRIAMLLSPNSTVVFLCCFEQLEMAITRRRSASLTERLHLLR